VKLREFIDKRSKSEIRGDLIRAIDLANDGVDIQEVVALIAGASQELDNDELLFIQDYFDKKMQYLKPRPEKRRV